MHGIGDGAVLGTTQVRTEDSVKAGQPACRQVGSAVGRTVTASDEMTKGNLVNLVKKISVTHHYGDAKSVTFSPCSRHLVSTGGDFGVTRFTCLLHGGWEQQAFIKARDIDSQFLSSTFSPRSNDLFCLNKAGILTMKSLVDDKSTTIPASCLPVFSPNGSQFAVVSKEQGVEIYSCKGDMPWTKSATLPDSKGSCDISFSADCRVLAKQVGKLQAWGLGADNQWGKEATSTDKPEKSTSQPTEGGRPQLLVWTICWPAIWPIGKHKPNYPMRPLRPWPHQHSVLIILMR